MKPLHLQEKAAEEGHPAGGAVTLAWMGVPLLVSGVSGLQEAQLQASRKSSGII